MKLKYIAAVIASGLLSIAIMGKSNTEKYMLFETTEYAVDGNVTEEFIKDTKDAIDLVPEEIREEFYRTGWKLEIGNTNERHYGLCDVKNKTLYIYYQNEIKDHNVADTLLHEFGHYIDYANGWTSKTEEFKALYKIRTYVDATRDDGYCYKNEQELFATLFRDLILRSDHLKSYDNYYVFMTSLRE